MLEISFYFEIDNKIGESFNGWELIGGKCEFLEGTGKGHTIKFSIYFPIIIWKIDMLSSTTISLHLLFAIFSCHLCNLIL